MSGSTDAATIAERTKLLAQLEESRSSLDDTYYNHSKDAQSQALDDENDAYVDAQEKYIEMLRDTLDDTMAIVNQKISEFLLNADVGLDQLNGISTEHGITLSDALMQPWENASMTAEAFKNNATNSLYSLINEDGVVTIFNAQAIPMLESVFSAGGSAAMLFTQTVNTQIEGIKGVVQASTSPLTTGLAFPWDDTARPDGPITTFSEKAKKAMDDTIDKAQNDYQDIQTYLASPWGHASDAVNTFARDVADVLGLTIAAAQQMGAAIDEVIAKKNQLANVPSYTGGGGGGGGGGNPPKTTTPTTTKTPTPSQVTRYKQTAQKTGTLGQEYFAGHPRLFDQQLETIDGTSYYKRVVTNRDGKTTTYYYKASEAVYRSQNGSPYMVFPKGTGVYLKKMSQYAKGTTGTDRDELAIVDELGPELIMHADPTTGRLQYLTKGSSVVPHDVTQELMKIANIGVDGLAMPKFDSGINIMSNAINKPELNISFDALVKAEKITEDTLPAVKQLVKEELDKFSRQLGYSLKKIGAH